MTRRMKRGPMDFRHEPVLLDQAVDLWAAPSARRVVDGTVGHAGHSLELLRRRPDIHLLAVDRDPAAVEFVRRRFSGFGDRAQVVHGSYADLPRLAHEWAGGPVDGLLLDLGVSSPQIDDPGRGFSTRRDGPLDMRFDPTSGHSAREFLSELDPEALIRILRQFGEEPRAPRVARAILEARDRDAMETTTDLRRVLEGVAGRRPDGRSKSAARVFQALRIAVNDELGQLDCLLDGLQSVLAPGGRVAAISFHSLEDRRVKRAFRDAARACECPPESPLCRCGGDRAWLQVLTRRAVVASSSEREKNPRSRSAKLRAAERLPDAGESC
ncbi:MAG: 16S rRNA (cytosine(1402)-N(4))-methyltransferase [Gemmatimonadetes bacterium]|nr:16S rRNA (cytosine(1402)-N(4))-methyltransferase [Gemmatimonadota bacterium]